MPILSVQEDTYQTAMNIGHVRSYISADAGAKIRLSLHSIEVFSTCILAEGNDRDG